MTARIFTDEQIEEICTRYRRGESAIDLEEFFGVNRSAIYRILKRNGERIRSIKESQGGLDDSREADVCARYQMGESSPALAKAMGVSSNAICSILRRHGIKTRSSGAATRKLTDEQELEICRRYIRGETRHQLALAFSVSKGCISNIIDRQGREGMPLAGIRTKTPKEAAKRKFTDEQELEICRRYIGGENSVQLAAAFGVADGTIRKIVKRNGVKLRSRSEAKGGLSELNEAEVCRRYQKGESAPSLAAALGVTVNVICRALQRCGVTTRPNGEAIYDQLSSDLTALIESLGDHLHELPQKAWLRLIKQATASIGPKSKLHPIKVKLLTGEIGPGDILPPPQPERPDDDAAPAEPPAISKLQEELNRLRDGDTDADYDEVQDEYNEVVEGDYDEVQDDDDERRAQLIRLTPQRVLDQMSVIASTTSDEAALESIRHDAVERLWQRVFLSDDQVAEVAAIRAAQPADNWAELLRNSFLSDWRLIEKIGEIPGFKADAGFSLNLMQRREAALLLRDRHRLNISGMGAGKTLAAIAAAHLCGCERVLALAPNSALSAWQSELSQHFPDTAVASKTWHPHWMPTDHPRWLINNHEMLGDYSAQELAVFIEAHEPDAVIIDELHLCKMRDERTESQRHRNLATLCDQLRDSAVLLGLTGTPVVNQLGEAIGLLKMIRPDLAVGLKPAHTIDNCLAVHEALQPISSRYIPPLPCKVTEQHIEVRADYLYDEAVEACSKHAADIDAVLVQAKLDQLVTICQRPGKTVVFTASVKGVVDAARDALNAAGIRCVVHTGLEKDDAGVPSVELFLRDPAVRVLIASTGTLATGFDGLQKVCARLCYLTLPWTPAEYDQSKHRVIRQGSTATEIELFTISAALFDPEGEEDWSYDTQKLGVLTGKRTVLDAVTDGVIPDQAALKFSLTEARRAHKKMLQRVKQSS